MSKRDGLVATGSTPTLPPASNEMEKVASGTSRGQTRKLCIRCYNCQKKGHYASDCPGLQFAQWFGNHQKAEQGNSTGQVSVVTSALDCKGSGRAARGYNELRLQHKTMPNNETEVTTLSETVGPCLYVTVRAGGCDVEAMIDTGSLVCIISETELVQVAKKGGSYELYMKHPQLRLTDYHQFDMPVSGQVDLEVSFGNGSPIVMTISVSTKDYPLYLLGLDAALRLGPDSCLYSRDAKQEATVHLFIG